jgi:hypothetical protein
MNNDSNMEQIPKAIAPPAILDLESGQLNVWTGKTTMRSNSITIAGEGRVYLDLLPIPEFRFEFNSSENSPSKDKFFAIVEKKWEMDCGLPIGPISLGSITHERVFTGGISDQIQKNESEALYKSAKFLVINGPFVDGERTQRDGQEFYGRMLAKIGDTTITIDPLIRDRSPRRCIYRPTHVILCEFTEAKSMVDIDLLRDDLFRTLSFMKCRWVGLVGPWLTSENPQAISFRLSVTKTMRNSGSATWCHKSVGDCFAELAPKMFQSFADSNRGDALKTALHWLVEAEQCAGGIEGSMILQQSALECLSWLAVVIDRRLFSYSRFDKFKAAEKIRKLLSIYKIDAGIPDSCLSIQDYANDKELTDLVDVMVSVRNALVHADPKKVTHLFSRVQGEDERTELWYQTGGLLQQALLASVGYQGLLRKRDPDAGFAVNAVIPAPWASSTPGVESVDESNH